MTYTDIKGVEVKVDDILKYDEGEGFAKCIDKVLMHEGAISGQCIVGGPEWTTCDDAKPISLRCYCYSSGTQFIDAEIIGNINDNPEMMTPEHAEELFK